MTTILPRESRMPSLAGATEWLNSDPLTAANLQGRVVLVDFGTYTCINWLRTLPHIRAWAAKYREERLFVVGIQTPEFAFEENVESGRREVAQANQLAGRGGQPLRDLAGVQQPVPGPPCTSSTVKASSAITTSAKGGTSSPSA
jgi:thiol-disulfide isomerase/thioredoxin